MKRVWAIILTFLLIVGILASATVLASILATYFGENVTITPGLCQVFAALFGHGEP